MNIESKEYFYVLIIVLGITDLVILLDIPFLRQIFGFIFLTILPGLLILQILKLNKIGSTEKFVLTVGLSISFLLFFGLLLNNSLLGLGYKSPLSTGSLLFWFNITAIILIFIAYRMNNNAVFSLPNFDLTTPEKAFLIVPILFPALSIFGMHVMNTTDNNIILMFLLFLIPIYLIFACFFNHKFSKRLYPVVIFLISISLLLLMSLRSNHIIGNDAHLEYYYFQTTLDNLHWSVFGHFTLDACLTISLLPTIYQSILNISSEFLFKILYSLLFSVSPLIIYIISKKYIGELYGFLTSCFFMFQHNFLSTPLHARTNTAILFFALAMMILFSDKIDPLKKRILFIVFMASCTVSHYSTTYIFFFVMLGAFMGMEILAKKYTLKKIISFTITILFFTLIFFWYSQVTEAAFNSGVRFIENTFTNLNKFFVEEMRSSTTHAVLGKDIWEKGIPHKIEFMLTWLTFAFIGIGIITLIKRYKEMSFSELNLKKPDFLKNKFEVTYFVIALVLSGLLIATVALPYITVGYSLERQYILAIVVLSVFFVIGGITLSKHFLSKETFMTRGNTHEHENNKVFSYQRTCAKKDCNSFGKAFLSKKRFVLKEKQKSSTKNTSEVRAYLIILVVLILYFLCVTGVSYQMFGVPRAITLNSEGEQYDMYYVHDQEIIAGGWLRSSEVVRGRLVNKQKTIGNMTEYLGMFDEKDRIYDNGGSEVWK